MGVPNEAKGRAVWGVEPARGVRSIAGGKSSVMLTVHTAPEPTPAPEGGFTTNAWTFPDPVVVPAVDATGPTPRPAVLLFVRNGQEAACYRFHQPGEK